MSLTVGNSTASNPNPNSDSYTVAHNHGGTNNAYLVVFCTMDRYRTYTGCTYNGTVMTEYDNYDWVTEGQRAVVYYLANPDTGSNNIVLSFGGGLQQRNMVFYAQSFTNCGGLGVDGVSATSTSPNSKSLTIAENSRIVASGISIQAQSNPYSIGGSNTTSKSNGSSYLKQVEYHLSVGSLAAGATNVTTYADSGSISNYRVEITEAVSGPTAAQKSSAFFMLA